MDQTTLGPNNTPSTANIHSGSGSRTKLMAVIILLVAVICFGFGYYYLAYIPKLQEPGDPQKAAGVENPKTTDKAGEGSVSSGDEKENGSNVSGQDSGWQERRDPKRGYSMKFPAGMQVYQPEGMAGNFLFCDQPLDDVNRAIALKIDEEPVELMAKGCVTSVVLSGDPKTNLDSLVNMGLFPQKKNLSATKTTTLKEKTKITLGGREFYRVIYWTDTGKGGTYNYITLLAGGKPLWLIFSYDDYSIRNERFVPQIEEILTTIKEQ